MQAGMATGNGIEAEIGTMEVVNVTLVKGDGVGPAQLIGTIVNNGQTADFVESVEVDGKPVGAVFCLLDYNPRIKAIDGRLFPFGFLRLLWNKKAIKRLRAISTNVVPEYQAWGIGLVLMNGLYERFMKWGLREVEFSWVLESNYLSRRTLERGGALVTKKYRMYQDDPPRP